MKTTIALGLALLISSVVAVGQRISTQGCPTAPVAAPSQTIAPDDFVELRRTTCLGRCPAYTVRIRGDGQVSWRGDRFVEVTGDISASVPPADARALIEKVRAMGFWNLCANYRASVTDDPTYIVVARVGDQEKRVSDYARSAPDWINEIEMDIDALADTHRWIHGDPRKETFRTISTDGLYPKPGVTPLMRASAINDVAEIRRLLANKSDPNAQDSSGWTALMYGLQGGRQGEVDDTFFALGIETAKVLIAGGANPNAHSAMGQSALMAATSSFNSSLEKSRVLLAAGARADVQDADGKTALMFAVRDAMVMSSQETDKTFLESAELITALRVAGARTDTRDAAGLSVFDQLEELVKRMGQGATLAERIRRLLEHDAPGATTPVAARGRVVVARGGAGSLTITSIELVGMGVGMTPIQVPVASDGSFLVEQIQPGVYAVNLKPVPSFPLPVMSLKVPARDVNDIEFTIPAMREISISVTMDGAMPPPTFALALAAIGQQPHPIDPATLNQSRPLPSNLLAALTASTVSRIQLIRFGLTPIVNDASMRVGFPSPWDYEPVSTANPMPDGSFRIVVPEGEYWAAGILPYQVSLSPLAGLGRTPRLNYVVKSLTKEGADLMETPLKVDAATANSPLRVALATTTPDLVAKVSGRLVDRPLSPPPGRGPQGPESQFGPDCPNSGASVAVGKVLLLGPFIAPLDVPVRPDGTFAFPPVPMTNYVARAVPTNADIALEGTRPQNGCDRSFNLTGNVAIDVFR